MKTPALICLLSSLFAGPVGSDPVEADFGTLAGFDYVEGMQLPDEVTAFDGKTVKVSGFMAREDGGDGDTDFFMLINDACGCDGTPMMNEVVFCAMPRGQTSPIHPGTVSITGTLYVSEDKDEGVVVSLYTLDVDSITP